MQHDSEAINLTHALSVIRRRVWLIALCIVVAAGAAFGFSKHQTKKYTATASLSFSSNPLIEQIAGLSAGSSSSSSTSLLAQQASDVELAKLGGMAAKTAGLLGNRLTPQEISESVRIAGKGESGVVNIAATLTSPVLAADIANAYAREVVKEQQSSNQEYYKSALMLVHRQLAALSPQQRIGTDGVELQYRAQELGLLSELQYGNVQVAQEAITPISPSSPKTKRNTLIGGVLGLLVGFIFVFLLETFDRRIRDPEDLEAIYRLPMLGAVPQSTALSRSGRDKGRKRVVLPPAEAEAFSLIRAHLRFFNINRDLRTVVIASAAMGDGKTTIARNLAEAAARSGSRALLVELDLRQPTLAQQLDIRPGPGLAEVLIGATRLDEAIQSVELATSAGEGARGRTLVVLTAGAILPPNPGELLESNAMGTVLERARTTYDLVVIDTPPLTAVSDAFPLLTKVDGVVIVGWIGRSRRDVAERLHHVLASSGAPLLGVIANGSKSGSPSPYPRDGKRSSAATAVNGSTSEEFVPTVQA